MPDILDEAVLKKIRNTTLLISVFYLAAGILLIVFSSQVRAVIGYAIGVAAIAIGVWRLILYAASHRKKSLIATDLFAGCVLIALGILCIIFHARIVDYVALIFGILLLIGSAVEMQNAIDLRHMDAQKWWIILLFGFLSLALGILLILYPEFIRKQVMLLSGIFFTYDGATGLAAAIWAAGRFHSMRKAAQSGEKADTQKTDAGETEEDEKQEDVFPDDADVAEYEPIPDDAAENENPQGAAGDSAAGDKQGNPAENDNGGTDAAPFDADSQPQSGAAEK